MSVCSERVHETIELLHVVRGDTAPRLSTSIYCLARGFRTHKCEPPAWMKKYEAPPRGSGRGQKWTFMRWSTRAWHIPPLCQQLVHSAKELDGYEELCKDEDRCATPGSLCDTRSSDAIVCATIHPFHMVAEVRGTLDREARCALLTERCPHQPPVVSPLPPQGTALPRVLAVTAAAVQWNEQRNTRESVL